MLIVSKQDNVYNLFSIWNTVSNKFLGVNLSYNECIELVREYKGCSYDDAKEIVNNTRPFIDIIKQMKRFEMDYEKMSCLLKKLQNEIN